jgi:hypothetical protein
VDIALVLAALGIIGVLMGAMYRERKIFRQHFIAVLRLSWWLSHSRLTGGRPYRKYYFKREQDREIRSRLNAGNMKATKGKANPKAVNELLRQKLS